MYFSSKLPQLARWVPLIVGVAGLAFTTYLTFGLLADNAWNPSTLIKFPEIDQQAMEYAENLLGDVVPSPGFGHDGKFYFTQAQDPFYLNPDQHAFLLDRPTYRAQRMLYPVLAGGFGLFSPGVTAWGLLVVNLLATGIGSWLTAHLARELGLSALFGLGFAFNPGILVSSLIDTAEVLAMLFFVLAALMLLRRRLVGAAVAITLSSLTRETMILGAVGMLVYMYQRKINRKWLLLMPVVATAGWWIYLRFRIGSLVTSVQDTEALGLPLQGFIEAMGRWTSSPVEIVDLTVGMTLFLLAIAIPWLAFRDKTLVGAMTAGFALIALVMVEPVWRNYFDASRALAPLVTSFLLMRGSFDTWRSHEPVQEPAMAVAK